MQVVIDEYDCKYIMDPSVTVSKVYLYFYLMANLGMLSGSTAMFYAEQRVGFWLAFLVPTLVLCKSLRRTCVLILPQYQLIV
jgi:POT family proton-dependent oligopeptide transporter